MGTGGLSLPVRYGGDGRRRYRSMASSHPVLPLPSVPPPPPPPSPNAPVSSSAFISLPFDLWTWLPSVPVLPPPPSSVSVLHNTQCHCLTFLPPRLPASIHWFWVICSESCHSWLMNRVLFSSASSVDAHHNNHYSSHSSHAHQAIPATHHNHSSSYTGIARTGVLCCPSPRWPTPSSTTESVANHKHSAPSNPNWFDSLIDRSLMSDSEDASHARSLPSPPHHLLFPPPPPSSLPPPLHPGWSSSASSPPSNVPVASWIFSSTRRARSIFPLTCSTVIATIIFKRDNDDFISLSLSPSLPPSFSLSVMTSKPRLLLAPPHPVHPPISFQRRQTQEI